MMEEQEALADAKFDVQQLYHITHDNSKQHSEDHHDHSKQHSEEDQHDHDHPSAVPPAPPVPAPVSPESISKKSNPTNSAASESSYQNLNTHRHRHSSASSSSRLSNLHRRNGSSSRGSGRQNTSSFTHHHHTSQEEEDKISFLIPRAVTVTFGPYFHLGILDYRTERLKGFQRILKKCGAAVVTLKPTFRINEVRAWHLEQPFFTCKITDLHHGGDGELDELCILAGLAFEKSIRRAYHNLIYRYGCETSELKTGCAQEQDPAFQYYERILTSTAAGGTAGSDGSGSGGAELSGGPSFLMDKHKHHKHHEHDEYLEEDLIDDDEINQNKEKEHHGLHGQEGHEYPPHWHSRHSQQKHDDDKGKDSDSNNLNSEKEGTTSTTTAAVTTTNPQQMTSLTDVRDDIDIFGIEEHEE